ncbi:MAG: UbiA prenyltransferase family protein [Candidatus Thermoplasmatota archaeon]|nr:UbiA prenyltransferase family protein [Candidatus Thermoplasmatota archaeon]
MSGFGEVVIHRMQVYLSLLRPFTLLAPLIVSSSVIIASLVYSGADTISIIPLLWTLLSASACFALLNGASNVLNQATDWKEDVLSKPYRPIPKGIVSPTEAFKVSFFFYATALLLSFTIHFLFCFFICIIAFFSITYSLRPRMKKFLFINQAWVALPRGFFGIVASWSVFGNPFEPLPLAIGCIAALFLFGGTTTKDILDAEADRAVGTKTLVNVYGLRLASIFSLLFMVGAFLLILPLAYWKILPPAVSPLAILSILSVLIGWLMLRKQKNIKCENTSAWTLMYATYFTFALSFAVITIFLSG